MATPLKIAEYIAIAKRWFKANARIVKAKDIKIPTNDHEWMMAGLDIHNS